MNGITVDVDKRKVQEHGDIGTVEIIQLMNIVDTYFNNKEAELEQADLTELDEEQMDVVAQEILNIQGGEMGE